MKFAGIMIDANGTDRQRTAGHTKWHTDGPQGLWLNAKLWEPSLTAPDTRCRDRARAKANGAWRPRKPLSYMLVSPQENRRCQAREGARRRCLVAH